MRIGRWQIHLDRRWTHRENERLRTRLPMIVQMELVGVEVMWVQLGMGGSRDVMPETRRRAGEFEL